MNIKILQLETWQKNPKNFINEFKEIQPIFNREGVYLKNKFCWFEVNGKAYLYDNEGFNFRLTMLNIPNLSLTQIEALKQVVKYKIASKEQIELYLNIKYLDELRKTSREISLLKKSVLLKNKKRNIRRLKFNRKSR